ncbi:hypothetical protein F7725_026650 [Dissostichus mawsoni]|uniref:Uncharacterized protein n=1 Tax=Dissostichus mawsoni TaxID=36200 RepID=A0A7J5X7P5_DISMA|nr:hypothetical protein F7725_026650 [Dissostichus mawsoni]
MSLDTNEGLTSNYHEALTILPDDAPRRYETGTQARPIWKWSDDVEYLELPPETDPLFMATGYGSLQGRGCAALIPLPFILTHILPP